jgi:PAS domain S-box-containing protein
VSAADHASHLQGDDPRAASESVLADRRELALIAVERTRMPMVVSDPRLPDNPIVLANTAFLELCGYAADEVLGRNCRFLQGSDTDPRQVAQVREGLTKEAEITVELLNLS